MSLFGRIASEEKTVPGTSASARTSCHRLHIIYTRLLCIGEIGENREEDATIAIRIQEETSERRELHLDLF